VQGVVQGTAQPVIPMCIQEFKVLAATVYAYLLEEGGIDHRPYLYLKAPALEGFIAQGFSSQV